MVNGEACKNSLNIVQVMLTCSGCDKDQKKQQRLCPPHPGRADNLHNTTKHFSLGTYEIPPGFNVKIMKRKMYNSTIIHKQRIE